MQRGKEFPRRLLLPLQLQLGNNTYPLSNLSAAATAAVQWTMNFNKLLRSKKILPGQFKQNKTAFKHTSAMHTHN